MEVNELGIVLRHAVLQFSQDLLSFLGVYHVCQALDLLNLNGLPVSAALQQVVDVGDGVRIVSLFHAALNDIKVFLNLMAVLQIRLDAVVFGV